VIGGCEASEGIHSIVSENINNWTSRTEHAVKTVYVVETLRDLNITIPGCRQPVHPHGQTEMGRDIPEGMSIVDLLIQIDGFHKPFRLQAKEEYIPHFNEILQAYSLDMSCSEVFGRT
jgi:hypothetical protein